jgi:hypothetical protein
MPDTSPHLDQISSSQTEKEVALNALLNAELPAAFAFGKRLFGFSSGLTWAFYGLARWYINATATAKANSTVSVTGSSTRYLAADRALAVTDNATAFPTDKLALYKLTTSGSAVTAEEDHRDPHHLVRFLYGRLTKAMADANQTLSYEEAMCESLEATGALTALRDIIVPAIVRDWKVYANTSGGFGVRVKTSGGTGITIADTKRAIVECDGTNVVRITPDT